MSNARRATNPTRPRRQGTPRGMPLIVAAVAVLCVGAIVALALWGGGGESPSDQQAAAGSMSADGKCESPPAPPAQPPSFSKAPDPAVSEQSTWEATLATNCGDITLELDGAKAPQTVASFITLGRGGYWDDSPCHRLTTAQDGLYVLQCGDPTGTGSGDPGYGFGVENAPEDGSYPRGTLAMARTNDPNSNGGQFFIVYKDTSLPTQGGGYSIFGRVTDGMDIVDAIARQGAGGAYGPAAPKQPISILGVTLTKL